MTINNFREMDRAHLINPVSSFRGHEQHGVRMLTSGHGMFLLDALAGLWCVNIGYGQQSVVDAAIIAAYASRNQDRVHFVFQPAEEGRAGARIMLDQGLFDDDPSDACFSLHNWAGLALGHLALCDRPIMAGGRRFRIEIKGRGAHAAQPHLGRDPVVDDGLIADGVAYRVELVDQFMSERA